MTTRADLEREHAAMLLQITELCKLFRCGGASLLLVIKQEIEDRIRLSIENAKLRAQIDDVSSSVAEPAPDELRWESAPGCNYRVFPWLDRWSWHYTEVHDGYATRENAEVMARDAAAQRKNLLTWDQQARPRPWSCWRCGPETPRKIRCSEHRGRGCGACNWTGIDLDRHVRATLAGEDPGASIVTAEAEAPEKRPSRSCTCVGSCRGAGGLGVGWSCMKIGREPTPQERAAYRDERPSESRWRTLIRVVEVEVPPCGNVAIVVPAWNHERVIYIPKMKIHPHVRRHFAAGFRLHARVNLAATNESDLQIGEFELPADLEDQRSL